jgi:A/G-specific adenine glycosylase
MATRLLAWYDRHAREFPWRVGPAARRRGIRPDPYRVWLSEVMLQQTTAEAVRRYYASFLERWPDLASLAAAPTEEVMKAWAGLGYYSRARNLKACAEALVTRHRGRWPDTEEGLRALPGVGAYTAAAIAAIAFERPAAVVDGNVERVTARFLGIETPLPRARAEIRRQVAAMLDPQRPGDFAQAMMDLGATLCAPRRPSCMDCPLNADCAALARGDPARLPVKAPRPDRPRRAGAAFVAVNRAGAVLLRRRGGRGLLAGMSEVPTSGWSASRDGATGAEAAPFAARWRQAGVVHHVFTHFELSLAVFRADVGALAAPEGCWWSDPAELAREALPSVMRKAIAAACPGLLPIAARPSERQTGRLSA